MYKKFSLVLYITSVVLVFHLQSIRIVLDEAGEVLTKETDSVLYSSIQSSFFHFQRKYYYLICSLRNFPSLLKYFLGTSLAVQ